MINLNFLDRKVGLFKTALVYFRDNLVLPGCGQYYISPVARLELLLPSEDPEFVAPFRRCCPPPYKNTNTLPTPTEKKINMLPTPQRRKQTCCPYPKEENKHGAYAPKKKTNMLPTNQKRKQICCPRPPK